MLSFLGIGAQKAGTTWLYTMLSQHPAIHFPCHKEMHFWNRVYDGNNAQRYFSRFHHPQLVEGEITPAYGHLPLLTIQSIYHYRPELKLIYVIRNPVDRAWSSALMALNRAEMEFNEASDQWFIDHFNSSGSLQRGDYETCLKNWRSVFPDKQLLVLLHDEIRENPAATLARCCNHLEVNNFTPENLEKLRISRKIFTNPPYLIRNNLASELDRLYSKKINSLEAYLGIDLGNWLKKSIAD